MNYKQQQVFDDFCNKTSYNIAILGGAGKGKSFVFKNLVNHCASASVNFLVSAMTGVAAELIGGRTLHSVLGIGRVGKDTSVDEIILLLQKFKKVKVWKLLEVLFIDEISMMTGELFVLLHNTAQKLRLNNKPFGGIRLIVCGDFLQLGPVEKGLLCFESQEWKNTFPQQSIYLLTEPVRQKEDLQWGEILNRLSKGLLTNADKLLLFEQRTPAGEWDNVIRLYCTNYNVDKLNNGKLTECIKAGNRDKIFVSECKSAALKRANVHICIGAKVMHTINNPTYQIWNGSVGTVTNFDDKSICVLFDNGKTVNIGYHTDNIPIGIGQNVTSSFIPLKLAWALTIHKSQGSTLDKGIVNLHGIFLPGQVYTALSRFKTLKGIKLESFYPKDVIAEKRCVEFYNSLNIKRSVEDDQDEAPSKRMKN
jgi:hypothetical protein